jgi:hypothetical protein
MPNEWQKKCTQELQTCVAMGSRGAAAWSACSSALQAEAKQIISKRDEQRVVIADCDLRGIDLKSYVFQYTYLARVDFTGADLSGANFDRAILSDCKLVRADLRGAQFIRTKIDDRTIGWDVRFDRTTRFAFTSGADSLVGFDPDFRSSAEEASRIANYHRASSAKILLWLYGLIDHGRSVWRLSLLCAGIIALFAAGYALGEWRGWLTFDAGKHSYWAFVVMSAQQFINGNPMFSSSSLVAQTAFLAEALLGWAALALFAATILRKLVLFR